MSIRDVENKLVEVLNAAQIPFVVEGDKYHDTVWYAYYHKGGAIEEAIRINAHLVHTNIEVLVGFTVNDPVRGYTNRTFYKPLKNGEYNWAKLVKDVKGRHAAVVEHLLHKKNVQSTYTSIVPSHLRNNVDACPDGGFLIRLTKYATQDQLTQAIPALSTLHSILKE